MGNQEAGTEREGTGNNKQSHSGAASTQLVANVGRGEAKNDGNFFYFTSFFCFYRCTPALVSCQSIPFTA